MKLQDPADPIIEAIEAISSSSMPSDSRGKQKQEPGKRIRIRGNEGQQYNDRLDLLRRRITDEQKTVLDEIWRHLQERHSSIATVILNDKFSEQLVHETLERLGDGIVVEEQSFDRNMKLCRLTFLGGLLASRGEEGEVLLAAYLEYIRELFRSDYEIRSIPSKDIEEELELTKDQSYLLKGLISLGQFGSVGGSDDGDWYAGFPRDVDDLLAQRDLRVYIRQLALAGVASIPLLNDEAQSRNPRSQDQGEGLSEEAADASIHTSSISDQPSPKDSLGFAPYVEAITEFLTNQATRAPLTLSIEGKWGSGKSSFMLQLEAALKNRGKITVRFNAWRHDKEDALWAAFALEFRRKLSQQLRLYKRLWARVKLALLRFNWKDGWFDAARAILIVFAYLIFTIAFFILLRAKGGEWLADQVITRQENKNSLQSLIKLGGVVGYVATFVFVLRKLISLVGNPFDKKLAKYIASPDYTSRVAFVEQFHEDFDKIVKAYAGEKTVYVFIDDLDRCEAPKAADLMQAINLMISDSDKARLIFIIGMDREQVAAALAVKQEKLLPYLGATAIKPIDGESTSFDPARGLEYGYKFIEKFIQLPFLVPQPVKVDLQRFLSEISGSAGQDMSVRVGSIEIILRIKNWLTTAIQNRSASRGNVGEAHPATEEKDIRQDEAGILQPGPVAEEMPPPTPEQLQRREQITVAVTGDSQQIHDITLMIAPAFDNNPRRLKQFINLFRLRVFIATNTGLFDEPERPQSNDVLTLEQLGKFVAISLGWPRLITDLDSNRKLLTALQDIALGQSNEKESSDVVRRWSKDQRLMSLLSAGCINDQNQLDIEKSRTYSLNRVNVDKLLQVSPRSGSTRPPRQKES